MNILILSKIYPAEDLSNAETPVVHYFAKEWVKQGHNVKVIVNYPTFPKAFYTITNHFENTLSSFLGSIPPRYCTQKKYQLDDVDIYRIPLKKYIPHGNFSKRTIRKQFHCIINYLEEIKFKPDIVIGHWWNPQLPLLKLIKDKINCKTALILHSDINAIRNYKSYFNGIDCWGFRSKALLNEFQKKFGLEYKTFICYSGIPEEMVNQTKKQFSFNKKTEKFIFVGQLIKRKYPAEIIKSIAKLYTSSDKFNITYIGAGKEKKRINFYTKKYSFQEHVQCLGRIPREDVRQHMSQSECFIMISKKEAFGLVYLEAMSAGCLVIASKNEGFDGIIEHGVNGFLCNAGDINNLSEIIYEINNLSNEEKERISRQAIKTAHIYTDSNVAQMYLDNILNLTKNYI